MWARKMNMGPNRNLSSNIPTLAGPEDPSQKRRRTVTNIPKLPDNRKRDPRPLHTCVIVTPRCRRVYCLFLKVNAEKNEMMLFGLVKCATRSLFAIAHPCKSESFQCVYITKSHCKHKSCTRDICETARIKSAAKE